MNLKRLMSVLLVAITFLTFFFFYYIPGILSGPEEKHTNKSLYKNFIEHERGFEDLIVFFKTNVPELKKRLLSFGFDKRGRITLELRPEVITTSSFKEGGKALSLDSPELDSVLSEINWTRETVIGLKNRLSSINCDFIRTTNFYGRPTLIFPKNQRLITYAYYVFDEPLADSLIKVHGRPLTDSEFGRKIIINHSSGNPF
jgi:hypothetical protein